MLFRHSGLLVVITAGIILAPVIHRVVHGLHADFIVALCFKNVATSQRNKHRLLTSLELIFREMH